MRGVKYYIWLAESFPYGSVKPSKILETVDDLPQFYQDQKAYRKALPFLTLADWDALQKTSLSACEAIIEQCLKIGGRILCYDDSEYPERLKNIYAPPVVLYTKGHVDGLDSEVAITVVGTRYPSQYGIRAAGNLSYLLARAGAVIVSGCAAGCDSYAHIGALKAGGRTIGVLACGLDVNYPAASAAIKQKMLEKGGLITELPPGTRPSKEIFPVRNRILSGLSLGVLVTEAPVRSGALLTAEHGLQQGRDIFCVPTHDIFDARFNGAHRLLNDGAIPVHTAADVLNVYSEQYPHKLDFEKIKMDMQQMKVAPSVHSIHAVKNLQAEVSPAIEHAKQSNPRLHTQVAQSLPAMDETTAAVYQMLSKNPKHISELLPQAEEKGIPFPTLQAILTELEISGCIVSLPGSRYAII